ncbi:cell division protein FtsZ [Candidatus Micrarchaeota archaeon]|nr:cell division protein FtsZ [Candidatus Micrarchaeota archaeon]
MNVQYPSQGGSGESQVSKDDAELLKMLAQARPNIAVVGAGGSGCNTLNRLFELGIEGASVLAVNTDVQHLLRIKADRKILIGKELTKGMGAGSNPSIGENAAKESMNDIENILSGYNMVFITCGLGGGTGTGCSPILAELAKKKNNALTVAIVTLPFISEGRTRMKNALEGLEKLRKSVDTVIVIPNDKLLSIAPDLPLNTAFKVCDEVLASSVKGITELVTKVGMVNLDFADLKTILTDAGCAVIGVGESSVDVKANQRALVATETALNSPLLDVDISSADRALINVVGGEDMTLNEAEMIVSEVAKRISPSSHIIWGSRVERNLDKNSLRVLIVIAGTKCPKYDLEKIMGSNDNDIDLDLVG